MNNLTAEELELRIKNRLIDLTTEAINFGNCYKARILREIYRDVNRIAGGKNWKNGHECDPFCEICAGKHENEPIYKSEV